MKEEQIYAGVLLVAAANNWSVQTAIHFLTLLTAAMSPAAITVANLFGTRPKTLETIVSQYLEAYADMLLVTGNHNIDCIFVDGVGFQCKWVPRQ